MFRPAQKRPIVSFTHSYGPPSAVNALPTSAMTRPYGSRNSTVRITAQVIASVPLDAA